MHRGWNTARRNGKRLLTLPKSIRERLNIKVSDYLNATNGTGKVVLQKVEMIPKKIDWENEDKVWKEYSAKRITRE